MYSELEHTLYLFNLARSGFLSVVTANIAVFWDMMPRSLVDCYQHFEGTHCLLLQGTLLP
jgi:hypothetical protein